MAQYRATVGIDYPPNKRVEAGEVVSDLPGESIKWLLEQGLIESTEKKNKPVVEDTPEVSISKIDLSDGLSKEEEKLIIETAATIESEKA